LFAAAMLCAPSVSSGQTCNWSIPGGINFETVDTLSGVPDDIAGTATINCSGSKGRTIRLCPNLNCGSGGLTESNRRLLNVSNVLSYQLYSGSWGGTIWGSDLFADPPVPPALTLTLNASGTGSLSATIYGRLFGGQSAALPGLYQSNYSGTHAQLRYQYCPSSGSCPPCRSNLNRSSNTSFTVSAMVASNCLVSATSLDFGSEGVLSANVDATNSVDIRCTPGTAWAAALGAGNGVGGTIALRRMTGPAGARLDYTIYRNAGRTEVWGDGTSGTFTMTGSGTGSIQANTSYGRVPAQTTPAPGAYADTIIVTVTY